MAMVVGMLVVVTMLVLVAVRMLMFHFFFFVLMRVAVFVDVSMVVIVTVLVFSFHRRSPYIAIFSRFPITTLCNDDKRRKPWRHKYQQLISVPF